jgi:hypothetical protein
MKWWAILVGIATLASIGSFLEAFVRDRQKSRLLAFALLATIFAGMSGYLAFRNDELTAARKQAKELAAAWPVSLNYNASDVGLYDGIITGGMFFLARYRRDFPEAYEYAQKNIVEPVRNSTRDNYVSLRLESAQAMITAIRSIAGERVIAPVD